MAALLLFGGAAQAHGEVAGETRPVVGGWSISAIWTNNISGAKCPATSEPPESRCEPHDTITQNGTTRYVYPSSNAWPVALAIGPDGNVWIANASGSIDRFNPTTNELTSYRAQPFPTEIVSGPDGALWFVSLWPSIGRITTSGELTEYPLPPGSGPTGLKVEANGTLGFKEQWAGLNAQITTTGQITTTPADPPAPARVARYKRRPHRDGNDKKR